MEASSVTNLLFEKLNFRGERQKVISGNIANINTPNYKTKDLVFSEELNKQTKTIKMAQTNSMHIPNVELNNAALKTRVVQIKGLQEQNDGNNVNLGSQMSEMAKNKIIYDAIQSSIKKDSSLFRQVISASSKN